MGESLHSTYIFIRHLIPRRPCRSGSKEDLDKMPWYPWDQIYNMVGHVPANDRVKKMMQAKH